MNIPVELLPLIEKHSAKITPDQGLQFKSFVQSHPKLFYKQQEFIFKDIINTDDPIETVTNDNKIEKNNIQEEKIYVYDVRIKCKGPDDKIYTSEKTKDVEKIRKWITRGCILIHHVNYNEWFLFQGFSKFTGMTIEDDDDLALALDENEDNSTNLNNKIIQNTNCDGQSISSIKESSFQTVFSTQDIQSNENDLVKIEEIQSENNAFFLKNINYSSYIFQVEKLNGKAAHFGVFKCNHKRYFVSGSKNVHIVFRNREDILKIPESSKILHCKIANMMLDLIENIKSENIENNELKEFFINIIEKSGLLMNFELLLVNDQHVVDYKLLKDELRFLAFTPRTFENDEFLALVGKCLPVPESLQWIKSFSINCATFKEFIYNKNNIQSIVKGIRNNYTILETDDFSNLNPNQKIITSTLVPCKEEGCVLYFSDNNKKVIGLFKVKSSLYIILRAIREKVVNMYKDFNCRIQHRLRQLKQSLNFSDIEYKKFCILSNALHIYVKNEIRMGNIQESSEVIRSEFASIYSKFILEYKEPNDIELAFSSLSMIDDDPLSIAKDCKKRKHNNYNKKNKRQRR